MKVKLLKNCGRYLLGEEVDVTDAEGEALCKITKVQMGDGAFEEVRKAMPLDDYIKAKKQPVDVKKMTAKDMADMRAKNIVPTPMDDAFDKKVKKVVASAKAVSNEIEKKAAKAAKEANA